MKKATQRIISLVICVLMLFGAAPLSGIAEIDFSKLNIFSGLHLPKLSLPEFDSPFGIKASAEEATSGTCGKNLIWEFDEKTGTLTISGEGDMDDYNASGSNGTVLTEGPWRAYFKTTVRIELRSGVTSV